MALTLTVKLAVKKNDTMSDKNHMNYLVGSANSIRSSTQYEESTNQPKHGLRSWFESGRITKNFFYVLDLC